MPVAFCKATFRIMHSLHSTKIAGPPKVGRIPGFEPVYYYCGEVQEWLNWLVSKTSEPVTVPRVRIPPSPPRK